MATKIFVNLPVRDLAPSKEFFTALGFTFDPIYTDERAACMVLSEEIYVMLLIEPFFRSFTGRDVPDTTATTGAIVALLLDDREEVDRIAAAALAAGAEPAEETVEASPMYTKSFRDLDGHHWELFTG